MRNQNFQQVESRITGSAQVIAHNVDDSSIVVMSVAAAPAMAGHNCTFEWSIDSTNGADGTWYQLHAKRTNAATLEAVTGVLAATPIYGWRAAVAGYRWIRIRSTAHTSGAALWNVRGASAGVL